MFSLGWWLVGQAVRLIRSTLRILGASVSVTGAHDRFSQQHAETRPVTLVSDPGITEASRNHGPLVATSSADLAGARNTRCAAEDLPLFAYENPDDGTTRVLC